MLCACAGPPTIQLKVSGPIQVKEYQVYCVLGQLQGFQLCTCSRLHDTEQPGFIVMEQLGSPWPQTICPCSKHCSVSTDKVSMPLCLVDGWLLASGKLLLAFMQLAWRGRRPGQYILVIIQVVLHVLKFELFEISKFRNISMVYFKCRIFRFLYYLSGKKNGSLF